MTLVPAGADRVPPAQVVAALPGVEICTPTGRVSVKARAVAATPLVVLVMVKIRVLVSPSPIGLGVKRLLNVGGVAGGTGGGGGVTVRVSLAVPLFPKDEIRFPVVLGYVPAVLLVTSMLSVQLVLAASVSPL